MNKGRALRDEVTSVLGGMGISQVDFDVTGSGHQRARFVNQLGTPVAFIFANTPSEGRGLLNLRAGLRKLASRGNARRLQ